MSNTVSRRAVVMEQIMDELALPRAVFTPGALALPDGLPYGKWADLYVVLLRFREWVQWWLADCLAYGERTYGESYAQAADVTGYDTKSLYNMAWVARRVPPSRRRDDLSFSHHDAVAALEPAQQSALLERAALLGWDRDVTRSAREAMQAGRPLPESAPEPVVPPECPYCHQPLPHGFSQ